MGSVTHASSVDVVDTKELFRPVSQPLYAIFKNGMYRMHVTVREE